MVAIDNVVCIMVNQLNKSLLLLLFCLCCFQAVAETVMENTATSLIEVKDGYIRGLPPGQAITAAFMRLQNTSNKDIEITNVQTPIAERAEFHQHIHNSGMMSMRKLDSITVPANGQFVLKPGGHHLMLFNLNRFLQDGDTAEMTLHFEGGDILTVTLPVRSVLNEHKR